MKNWFKVKKSNKNTNVMDSATRAELKKVLESGKYIEELYKKRVAYKERW